jgi:hypothetical protein
MMKIACGRVPDEIFKGLFHFLAVTAVPNWKVFLSATESIV